MFVLEELVRRFEPRIAIAALGASSTAILVSRLFLGDAPDFQVAVSLKAAIATGPLPYAAAATWPLYLVLGLFAGLAASSLQPHDPRRGRTRRAARSGLAGRASGGGDRRVVGVVGWFAPGLIGGGDTDHPALLAGGLLRRCHPVRFRRALRARAPLCYAARTPGGLFAPLLVLGAQLGLLAGRSSQAALPGLGIEPEAFAVVGMAAFFTGVVQAPVTGIVLVIEMTAAFTTLLPMLAACFAAMVAANLLRTVPIYDSLRERLGQDAAMICSLRCVSPTKPAGSGEGQR